MDREIILMGMNIYILLRGENLQEADYVNVGGGGEEWVKDIWGAYLSYKYCVFWL